MKALDTGAIFDAAYKFVRSKNVVHKIKGLKIIICRNTLNVCKYSLQGRDKR